MQQYLSKLSRYHRWATEKLFESVDLLSEDQYREDAGLYFGSIHNTLNHLLLVDQLWLARIQGVPYPVTDLGHEIETDLKALETALLNQCDLWFRECATLTDRRLEQVIKYRNMSGDPARIKNGDLLIHVFNHGTHHRGQISSALAKAGVPVPAMDYFYFVTG
ncbi:DinB family protein [Oceanospirillum sediminis]|uniref:DinB family protein n=1 Tax=Oceanospirillum sediminis TaxID=2760088 RepID=A0A839IJE4_9GAMM|nr:DinB family protein [Oceanospirillum sediminis]MBB1485463.1 DinB family protein [Oceanospirillum sediminis]